MKIAFQTLACPEWSWERIVEEAERLGFTGIEIRGVNGEMYAPHATPFLPENIDATMADLDRRGLQICCLDTSCSFHDPTQTDATLKEGRDYIDLAARMNVPYIRVFGDLLPTDVPSDIAEGRIAEGLTVLGQYAEGKGVTVLLETHGDVNNANVIERILKQAKSNAVGLLWDFEHPYLNGEEPETTYEALKSWIKHTHVKDALHTQDGKKLCLIGEGEVPVARTIELLESNGYDGWYALEFEKKWAPYLEEPEVSLPAFMKFMKNLM